MTSIKVPPLGESIVEATVSRWVKKEGDPVAPGDTLVELETDKITVEVPSVTGGVLKKQFAKEGEVVKLDQLLAEVDEKTDGAQSPAPAAKSAPSNASASSPVGPPPSPNRAQPPAPQKEQPRVSPAAQRVAAETGADLSKVQGSGRGGVISKADVIEAKSAVPSTPSLQPTAPPPRVPLGADQRETRERMSTRRKRIAEHLLESQ